MIKPATPDNEIERLKALDEYKILDTVEEKQYDDITLIASEICDTPIALVSLIDEKRQWFKSHHGLNATETPRELAFCAHAINKPNEILLVPDASKDERFSNNPLHTNEPNVVFYAGQPLNTPDGHTIGTLCVIDSKPRELNEKQLAALNALADQVVAQLELRKKNRLLNEQVLETSKLNDELEKFSYRLSHDIQTPIRGIASISQWLIEDHKNTMDEDIADGINLILDRAKYMDSLVKAMLDYSKANKSEMKVEKFTLANVIEQLKSYAISKDEKLVVIQENTEKSITQSKIGVSIVLQNLLTNSIKYNDKDACEIHISLNDLEGQYKIIFEDNGPGIPVEYQEKVFTLFETLNAKSESSTGIGLATVKSVVDRLGGSIAFDNENSAGGVRYEILLPSLNA